MVELAQPFDDLTGTGTIVVLGVLTAADFVGDKVPAVDHVLHAVGTVVAPVSGAVLFTGQTGVNTDLPTLAAVVLGAGTAETVHAGRAAVRPLSTVGTAGVGNQQYVVMCLLLVRLVLLLFEVSRGLQSEVVVREKADRFGRRREGTRDVLGLGQGPQI